ncbi:MoaA/NifB/PqqE/SkfB family radical SAM enzyme [Paraburkholderia graminis]|uniref:MoaA/NifB/PqqE/SkfB family radical SAM enzyme n=1 Tax=Paraburkholderia graminis TaxID=60548 RepID=A0ABD5CJM5_9BURK|nr:MoaA/NifB/PqqE/SkfB family radical SAM enzyme [Paraburkholderia graminis]
MHEVSRGKLHLVVGMTRRCLICKARGRATPESKAQSVLTQELRRQRNMVSRMSDTDREVTLVLDTLRELTRDPGFVALMNTRGFTTLPRLLHERLTGRPR